MGLISRVSSRTYRNIRKNHTPTTPMAETFKKNVVIDAQDHLAGRLCAVVAKELLRGNHVTVVRCEGIFITGNFYRNKLIMLEKMNHRTATNPKDGPFHHRAPSAMIHRMVRGMLPNKTGRGQRVHANLKCIDGCPAPYDLSKKFKIPAALKQVRSAPGRKIASLGRLCLEVGWQYNDVVQRLEAKRKANANVWYERTQKKAATKAQAIKACAGNKRFAKVDAELKAMGY